MDPRHLKKYLAFSLALALIFFGSTLFYGFRAGRYARFAHLSGERAAAQVAAGLESMHTTMGILPYTAGTSLFPQTAALLSRQAASAASALSALHLQEAHMEHTEQYLSQTEDLAHSLLVQHLAGFPLSPRQKEQLQQLCAHLDPLLEEARDIKLRLNAGELHPGDYSGGHPGFVRAAAGMEQLAPLPIAYDGLYSLREQAPPAALAGLHAIARQDAQAIAQRLTGASLPFQSRLESPIAAWCFGDGSTSVAVTETGGRVLRYLRDQPASQPVLTEDKARQLGLELAAKWGYENLEIESLETDGDRCTLVLVPASEGRRFLPDSVTLTLSLADGSLLSLDAEAYLTLHGSRDLPVPALTREEASGRLPGDLIPSACHEVLCASPGGRELLCYRFDCLTPDGQALQVTVRADNGALWALVPLDE